METLSATYIEVFKIGVKSEFSTNCFQNFASRNAHKRPGISLNGSDVILSLLVRQEEHTQHQWQSSCLTQPWRPDLNHGDFPFCAKSNQLEWLITLKKYGRCLVGDMYCYTTQFHRSYNRKQAQVYHNHSANESLEKHFHCHALTWSCHLHHTPHLEL